MTNPTISEAAQAAHTPGPWQHVITTAAIATQDRLLVATAAQPHESLAVLNDEQTRANARLIAAAPQMLAALKAVDGAFAAEGFDGNRRRVSEAVAEARAAIAAAKGEAR